MSIVTGITNLSREMINLKTRILAARTEVVSEEKLFKLLLILGTGAEIRK